MRHHCNNHRDFDAWPVSHCTSQVDRLVLDEDGGDAGPVEEGASHRSVAELNSLIRDLLKRNYQGVEQAFQDIDEINSGRLSKETMYQLLKRCVNHCDVIT